MNWYQIIALLAGVALFMVIGVYLYDEILPKTPCPACNCASTSLTCPTCPNCDPEINCHCPTLDISTLQCPDIVLSTRNIQAAHNTVPYEFYNGGILFKNVTILDVTGYSMQPTFFAGNKILAVPYTSREQLKEGQIIWYTAANGNPVVHRIKGLYSTNLVVQGDNMTTDETIQYTQIKYIIVDVILT